MASNLPVTRLSVPSIPEFTAWMMIEGRDVPLYGVRQEENKTICFVESKTGQNFAVHFSDTRSSRDYGYRADLFSGNTSMKGYAVRPDRKPTHKALAAARVSNNSERPFVFGEVSTTSDDRMACTDESVFKSLGSLELKIIRWSDRKSIPPPLKVRTNKNLDGPMIHEDSKKANFSHTASYGNERLARPVRNEKYAYKFIDSLRRPFHTFEFRYRSRAILEMENLIPDAVNLPQPIPRAFPVAGPSRPLANLSNASSDSHSLSKSASNPFPQAPIIISDDEEEPDSEAELSRLQDELAELERQSRMAAIKRRISGGSTSSGVKREGEEEGEGGEGVKKRVKLEKGGNGGSLGGMSKGKGKEKEVIVLSDSD